MNKTLGYIALALALLGMGIGLIALVKSNTASSVPTYGTTERHIDGNLSVSGTISGDQIAFTSVTNTNASITNATITNTTGTNLHISGTATINQRSLTGNVVTKSEMAMINATTTPCAFQNTTGRVLMITSLYIYAATSTSGGDVNFNVGTSSNSFTTSTSPLMNTVITRQSTNTVNVPTSTITGGGVVWEADQWIVAKSNTTTHSGECMVLTP